MRESAKAELVACVVCGRTFNPDRIEKHQCICEKSNKKKPPPTPPQVEGHVVGMDVASIVRNGQLTNSIRSREITRSPSQNSRVDAQADVTAGVQTTTDWRTKSQGLRDFIRSAKTEATEEPEQRTPRARATDWRKQSQGFRDFIRSARGDSQPDESELERTDEISLESTSEDPGVASASRFVDRASQFVVSAA